MSQHLPPQGQGLHPPPLYVQQPMVYRSQEPPVFVAAPSMDYEYILYVHPDDPNSKRAVDRIKWGPGELSSDGLIRYQNVQALKHHLPPWLTHVPTLGHVPTKTKWTGSACLEKLREIRETAEDKETTAVDPVSQTRGAVGSVEVLDPNQPVMLPPDPRDIANAASRAPPPEPVRPIVLPYALPQQQQQQQQQPRFVQAQQQLPPTPEYERQPDVRNVVLTQPYDDTPVVRHIPRPMRAPEDEQDGPVCDEDTGICRMPF